MIARENIDCLYLVVPPFAHNHGVELACAKARIPFLIEKPVGLDAKLCRKIAAAVKRARLVTSVGYMLREAPLVAEVRKVLGRNAVTSLRATRAASFPAVHWWRKMATSGGPMVEQTTHLVDLLRYVFGEITAVSALTSYGIARRRFRGADVFDSMEALMKFKSGLIGSIGLTDTYENGFSKIELFEAFGRDFYLTYAPERLRYREGAGDWVEITSPPGVDLLMEENKRFLAATEKDDPSAVLCTYADGLRTLDVTLAMNKAARTAKTVRLS
jgi:predicted dehydrogenase